MSKERAEAEAAVDRVVGFLGIPALLIGILGGGAMVGLETWQETQDPVQVITKGACGGAVGGFAGFLTGGLTGYVVGYVGVGLYRSIMSGAVFWFVPICSVVGLVGAFFVSGLSGNTSELSTYLMWGGGVGAAIGIIGAIVGGHPRH